MNKLYCPVTKKIARYIDPLTNIPYYDIEAFKLIRKAYKMTPTRKEKPK